MNYKKKDNDSSRHIMLPPKVVAENRVDFIELVERFTKSKLKTLILDFSDTRIIDSCGLGFILIAKQIIEERKKNLLLKNPVKNVQREFDLMSFDNIFTIEKK